MACIDPNASVAGSEKGKVRNKVTKEQMEMCVSSTTRLRWRNSPCSPLSGDLRPVEAAILVIDVCWFVFSEDINDSTEKAFAREERFPLACDTVWCMTV